MRKIIILSLFLLILSGTLLSAKIEVPKDVTIISFYGQGCPHCAKLHEFLTEVKNEGSNIKVTEYEIYFNEENRELFEKIAKAYQVNIQGVPTTFIDNKVLVGFNDAIGDQLTEEIYRCMGEDCINPLDKLNQNTSSTDNQTELKKKLTIPVVISAAIVDAINPCAFAVLIILLATILGTGNKRRALMAGIAFSLSIYISYFLMGLGLYSAINATGITHTFYAIVAGLAILIGLFNLKDYLWYGKWFVMEVPLRWRPRMKSVLRKVTSVPGAFFIGFVISLFLLPCTSGPYIVILGLLSKLATKNYAIMLLLLYNFIFILPMLLITTGIYFGLTTTKKAEAWRQRNIKRLHLIAGIIILLIGIAMFTAMGLGFI